MNELSDKRASVTAFIGDFAKSLSGTVEMGPINGFLVRILSVSFWLLCILPP